MSEPKRPAPSLAFRWCRQRGDPIDYKWVVVPVIPRDDGTEWIPAGFLGSRHHEADEPGIEWGERIPDSPRLAAMKLVCAADPRKGWEWAEVLKDRTNICRFCGCKSPNHTASCPWPRAQEPAPVEQPGPDCPGCGDPDWQPFVRCPHCGYLNPDPASAVLPDA